MNNITVTGSKSRKSDRRAFLVAGVARPASTGDPRMNAPWTALGTPAIIPTPVGKALPLGLQLTAEHGNKDRVLRTAMHLHNMLSRQRV